MRWWGFLCALITVLVAASATAATATSSHKLRNFEAREAAQAEAYEFQRRRHLDDYNIGRCGRKARRVVICLGAVTGETDRRTIACRLRIKVRAVYPGYWTTRAAIVWRRCSSAEKPFLSYEAAFAAIQAEADRFAGLPTTITSIFRHDDVTYAARAQWQRPSDPPSEYFPTEGCSVELRAVLAEEEIAVATEGFFCI